jgi:acyl-CoA thioesterase-1
MMTMNLFKRLQQRLIEKAQDVRARPIIYVAFGDSVTQGCMEYGVIEYEKVYHSVIKQKIEAAYPGTIISVINSGVSGDTAHKSRDRWHRDLLHFKPDFVTVAFGTNDCHKGESGIHEYIAAMSELIHVVESQTEADLLLLTPTNMLMSKVTERIDPRDEVYMPHFLKTADEGYLQQYSDALKMLLVDRGVPYVDVYAVWEQMVIEGLDINERLVNGLNHPDRAFHLQIADLICSKIGL